jgi:hypothetical protein
MRAGFASQDLACTGCTVATVGGGVGKAMSVSPRLAAFGMLDLAVQTRHADAGTLSATPRLGIAGSLAAGWKTYFSVGQRTYLGESRADGRVVRWENRFGGDRRRDFRLTYEENAAKEFGAALSLYW